MTDPIPPSRRKRFARRAVIALVAVVLLVPWYVISYFGAWWLRINGTMSDGTFNALSESLYAPISWYEESESPGSDRIEDGRVEVGRQVEMREMELMKQRAQEAALKARR